MKKSFKRITAVILSLMVVLVTNIGILPAFASSVGNNEGTVSYANISWSRSLENAETVGAYSVTAAGVWNYADKAGMPLTNPIVWDGGLKGSPAIPGGLVGEVTALWQRTVTSTETATQDNQPEGDGWSITTPHQDATENVWTRSYTETATQNNQPAGDGWSITTPHQDATENVWTRSYTETKTQDNQPAGDGWSIKTPHQDATENVWEKDGVTVTQHSKPDGHGWDLKSEGKPEVTAVWTRIVTETKTQHNRPEGFGWDKSEGKPEVTAVWTRTVTETITQHDRPDNGRHGEWSLLTPSKPAVTAVWSRTVSNIETTEIHGTTAPAGEGWSKTRDYIAPVEVAGTPAVQGQYFTDYSTRNDISWASWPNYGGNYNIRLFRGTFDLPGNVNIVSAHLGVMVDGGFSPIIPINDNIYVYLNKVDNRLISGGTSFLKEKQDGNAYKHTDGWYLSTGNIDLAGSLIAGTNNTLDIFTEEYNVGGGMSQLVLQYQTTPKNYSLNYSTDGNGAISGTASQTVVNGADGSQVSAVPNPGYHFTGWSDGVVTPSRTELSVTKDMSITALFAVNPPTVVPTPVPTAAPTATPAPTAAPTATPAPVPTEAPAVVTPAPAEAAVVAVATPAPTEAPAVATPEPTPVPTEEPAVVTPEPTTIPADVVPAGPAVEATPEVTEAPVATPEPAKEQAAIVVPVVKTPGAPAKLPKTGGVPASMFYGFGAGLMALGVVIRKKIK